MMTTGILIIFTVVGKKYIIFTEEFCQPSRLYPFTLTRQTQDLRLGILTIREKWERHLKLPSLAWFLTEEGKIFLSTEDKKKYLDIKAVEKIRLSENKIGEDKNICKKPKTLIEFITYGKKI